MLTECFWVLKLQQLIIKKLTSRQTTLSIVKQLSLCITRFFTGHCLMSGANIQACNVTLFSQKLKVLSLQKFSISIILQCSFDKILFFLCQKQLLKKVFCKKGIRKDFAKFKEKHLYWRLFQTELVALQHSADVFFFRNFLLNLQTTLSVVSTLIS